MGHLTPASFLATDPRSAHIPEPQPAVWINPDGLPETLLSRIEDAGINASAPPQQRWVDGWLLRYSPGKAKRARCVQAVADGRLPLAERLALCQAVMDLPDSRLDEEVWLPLGGGMNLTVAEVIGKHSWNLIYHLGQINQIQLMLGDRAMH